MSIRIEVKSLNPDVKIKRLAIAQDVVDQFGNQLPNQKLLAFFDDEDGGYLRRNHGEDNRGAYKPIRSGTFYNCEIWPHYVRPFIWDDISSANPIEIVDHVIYVHGTTCADEVGLIMTFAHELQHFVQHGFNRNLWAANSLVPSLSKEVIDELGLNWPDIPYEREARIVAKRVAQSLRGMEVVREYIERKIIEGVTSEDIDDWRFSKEVDASIPYDLNEGTKRFFKRLIPYRQDLEYILSQRKRQDDDFEHLDLAEFFDT